VSRGDVATLATHLRTLNSSAPDFVASYVAMARRTAERAHRSGRLDAEQTAAVIETLEKA
jgi:predicted short-subunit dehydrogenase-like oxidoreductase (DUF2520 family)